MSLTVLETPANYQLAKSPIIFKLQTNSYLQNGGSQYVQHLGQNAGNAPGGYVSFIWNKGRADFTFVSGTPDDSGSQLPIKGALSDAAYVLLLITYLKKNVLFERYFLFIPDSSTPGNFAISSKYEGSDYNFSAGFSQNNSGLYQIYHVAGTDKVYAANYKMANELWIETTNNSGVYELAGNLYQNVLDNKSVFYLQVVINSFLQYDLPTYNQQLFSECLNVFKRYYVKYWEQYGTPVTPKVLAMTDIYGALKAGIPSHEFNTANKTIARYTNTGKFLTRQPRTKYITKQQQEYLYIIAPFTMPNLTAVANDLKITVSFNEKIPDVDIVVTLGIASLLNLSTSQPEHTMIYCIPVGFLQLQLPYSIEEVSKYTVRLIYDSAALNYADSSETFTYIIDNDYYPDETFLYFTNSDSGFDTIRCTGVKEEAFEIENENVQRIKLYDAPVTTGEFSNINNLKKNTYKVSTGWITKAQADWLEDFFVAEQKFVDYKSMFVPIIVTSSSVKKYDSKSGKIAYTIEYYHAFTNTVANSI
jgi:hypothetical protein